MRYSRQTSIPQIGEDGQKIIQASRIAVVGVGGLGSPVLIYLSAAGIGNISIFDSDFVEISNLNRQVLHWENDICNKKINSATEKLRKLNHEINFTSYEEEITEGNATEYLKGHDVIVSCVDNYKTRYLLARTGLALSIPVVEAGVRDFRGFQMNTKRGFPCIGCIWGLEQDSPQNTPILGATAGVLGSLQVIQALKILLNSNDSLFGKIWFYDLYQMSFNTLSVKRNPHCPICGDFY